MTFSSGGALEGTPAEQGSFFLGVSVRTDGGQWDTQSFVLDVDGERIRVAFLGDQGWEPQGETNGPRAVLKLIREEGVDLVIHAGDFDYGDDPQRWMQQINDELGPEMPYVAVAGNHDEIAWGGAEGYQALLEERAGGQGLEWTGVVGERSSIRFRGIRIVTGIPDVLGSAPGADSVYFTDELRRAPEPWRICVWHKNQRLMQVGDKGDEAGWGVYEACRLGGAIMATGHEHSYSRTHLLANIRNQTISATGDTLDLSLGASFVLVSGLGGLSIRPQVLDGPWWAAVYTATQGATFGALFGEFDIAGEGAWAHFYFKDISGTIVDEFFVRAPVVGGRSAGDGR